MKKFLIFLISLLPLPAYAKLPSQDDTPHPPRTPGASSFVLRQTVEIDADLATIWDIMVDLPAYKIWNPWITYAHGQTHPGGVIYVDAKLGAITMRAKHVVLVNEPHRRFCWRDAGWNANFAYGQRCRTLTPQSNGQVLYTVEILIDSFWSKATELLLRAKLKKGLEAETEALKQRAEMMTEGPGF